MTAVEQIIKEIENVLTAQERFKVPKKTLHAMLEMKEPTELIEPILKLIETNPAVDFGTPGELVLFLEGLYDCGYEELLIESVLRNPTPHNIWMLHRCFNDKTDTRHLLYQKTIEKLRNTENVPISVRAEIERYSWNL